MGERQVSTNGAGALRHPQANKTKQNKTKQNKTKQNLDLKFTLYTKLTQSRSLKIELEI